MFVSAQLVIVLCRQTCETPESSAVSQGQKCRSSRHRTDVNVLFVFSLHMCVTIHRFNDLQTREKNNPWKVISTSFLSNTDMCLEQIGGPLSFLCVGGGTSRFVVPLLVKKVRGFTILSFIFMVWLLKSFSTFPHKISLICSVLIYFSQFSPTSNRAKQRNCLKLSVQWRLKPQVLLIQTHASYVWLICYSLGY